MRRVHGFHYGFHTAFTVSATVCITAMIRLSRFSQSCVSPGALLTSSTFMCDLKYTCSWKKRVEAKGAKSADHGEHFGVGGAEMEQIRRPWSQQDHGNLDSNTCALQRACAANGLQISSATLMILNHFPPQNFLHLYFAPPDPLPVHLRSPPVVHPDPMGLCAPLSRNLVQI